MHVSDALRPSTHPPILKQKAFGNPTTTFEMCWRALFRFHCYTRCVVPERTTKVDRARAASANQSSTNKLPRKKPEECLPYLVRWLKPSSRTKVWWILNKPLLVDSEHTPTGGFRTNPYFWIPNKPLLLDSEQTPTGGFRKIPTGGFRTTTYWWIPNKLLLVEQTPTDAFRTKPS